MKKKFFAVALAMTMVFSNIVSTSAQTLTGTKWWEGSQVGFDYQLARDGEIAFDVKCLSGDANDYAAFCVEVTGDNNAATHEYGGITTGSNQDAWYFGGVNGDALTGVAGEADRKSTVEVGEIYTIKVVRSKQKITVTYLNGEEKYAEYIADNTNIGNVINVHVIAQVGTFKVETDPEILTGTGWWDDGKEIGQNYELSGNGKIELYVQYQEAVATTNHDGPAFNIEVVDSENHCITTGSLRDAWYALGATGSNISINTGTGTLDVDSTYIIKVERLDSKVTVTYLNPDGTIFAKMEADGTNFTDKINVHVIAQVGKYKVSQVETKKTNEATMFAQYKPNTDGTYTVRIISEVALSDIDLTGFSRVGFRCSKTASLAGDNYLGTNIYKSIKANGETITAEDGKYFVILEIKNVTADAVLYAQAINESPDKIDTFGNEVTVNMANIIK